MQTVWSNCAGLIARLVSSVALRSQRCRRCNHCGSDTTLRELRVGDTFQDRRQPGHQDAAASLRARSQYLQENLWTTGRFRTALSGRRSDRDKQLLSRLRRASALALPRCVVSRYATAWAESLEGAVSGHQSWALLSFPLSKGVDRNSELKQRLHLWKSGQITDLISKVLGSRALGRLAERQEGCSHRQTNSAGSEPVP